MRGDGGAVTGEGVTLMVAPRMRFWLLPSRVSCVLLCPSLLLLLLLCCIPLLLVESEGRVESRGRVWS